MADSPAELLVRASPDDRARAVAWAVREALPAFERGAFHEVYIDSVVGMQHTIDRQLPRRVVEAIESSGGIPPAAVVERLFTEISEPVVALQDDDWELPEDAELALYAAYNLLRVCRWPDGEERAATALNQATAAALRLGYGGSDPEGVAAFLQRWRAATGLG